MFCLQKNKGCTTMNFKFPKTVKISHISIAQLRFHFFIKSHQQPIPFIFFQSHPFKKFLHSRALSIIYKWKCAYGCLSTGNWHQFNVLLRTRKSIHAFFSIQKRNIPPKKKRKYVRVDSKALTLHHNKHNPLDLVSYFISRSVISCKRHFKHRIKRPRERGKCLNASSLFFLVRYAIRVFGVMIIIINV